VIFSGKFVSRETGGARAISSGIKASKEAVASGGGKVGRNLRDSLLPGGKAVIAFRIFMGVFTGGLCPLLLLWIS
jgi:hypothetical protein